jgi:beta-fructofuranosidase
MSHAAADPLRHRPRWHFTTDNWMNDPIPFWAEGAYHVYFQHNPGAAVWGDMHWGHAISQDLAHWERLPIALAPTPKGPDHDGVWTGCVVRRDDSRFAALYTGIPHLNPFEQVHCLATSGDLWKWEKEKSNPIAAAKPEGYGPCFRDPQAWKAADGRWYMVIGGEQREGRGGAAFLYRAEDAELTRWTYLHPLYEGGPETGHDFECPDFFPLGRRHLFISSRNKTWWHVGTLGRDLRFTRHAFGPCDGGNFYAAKTCEDGKGRRILFGWITEARPAEQHRAAGWSGALSLPRVVTLGRDGTLRFTPAPELERLRGRRLRKQTVALGHPESRALVPGIRGAALELQVRFSAPNAKRYGIAVRCAPGGGEQCTVTYDAAARKLGDAPLTLAAGEELTMRVFVDGSVVEAFDAKGRACHTYRTYPTRPDSLGVEVFADDSPVTVTVNGWELG